MNSFETIPIDTAFFFKLTLIEPIKFTAILFFVFLALRLLCKWVIGLDNPVASANIPYTFFLLFKTILYGFLFLLVFFYDFSNHTWILTLPEKMPLSSAFVGVLAAYETISCLINAFQPFLTDNFK